MDQTQNYNLIKPTDDDFYDVADANHNMDIIDEELKKANEKQGNLALLQTQEKSSLVGAVNEVSSHMAQIMPETGTFTPTIKGSTTAGTHTYSQQQGKYTKIGNQVFFSLNVIITAKDGTMAGGVQIGGLPFAQNNAPYESTSIGSININMTDTAKSVGGIITGSNISLYEFFDNANTVALPSTAILATTQIRCSGVYEIA